jgi:sugar phosphate permease
MTRISPDEDTVYAKVTLRLIPFLFLCYIVAYLDRVNVGFAKLQMQSDLGLSDTVYGIGAGIFFIGYFFFEVPSNLLMRKVGARLWIARIMITWGLVSAATVFTKGAWSFYILRFLLGVAEAGFFPGVILYLTGIRPGGEPGSWPGL